MERLQEHLGNIPYECQYKTDGSNVRMVKQENIF